jgi:hypothetical protein
MSGAEVWRVQYALLFALLLCLAIVGVCLPRAPTGGDEFPFLATATVSMYDTAKSDSDGTFMMSARSPDDCIEKLDILAAQAADRFQTRDMSISLSCTERGSGRIMLYVKRFARQAHACDLRDDTCQLQTPIPAIRQADGS